MFIAAGHDAREKTAFGHVRERTVKLWNRCTKLDIFHAMVRLEGSAALAMEKYRRPRPASETGNLGFPRLDRALRIFAYREMFNFRRQKVAGYL